MNPSRDIHSLAEFQLKTPDFVRRMKESGDPIVLTIDGKAELVVQDAAAYQKLLDSAEQAGVIEGIRQGLEEMRAGRGQPAEQVLDEIRAEFEIPRDA
jgi:PHD/YefM family antitoxin component YafN of YafNO toxin-antitoxin module